MAEQTYYKLGLCPCGDMHNPFYLSEAKHRLPNGNHFWRIVIIQHVSLTNFMNLFSILQRCQVITPL